MIKSSIVSALFLLALSSTSLAQSKITFSSQCKIKSENGRRCLEPLKTCTLEANVKNTDGSVAKYQKITFETGVFNPGELGTSKNFLSRTTNGSGRSTLIIRPGPKTKGKKGTISVTPEPLGSRPIANGKLDLQICN